MVEKKRGGPNKLLFVVFVLVAAGVIFTLLTYQRSWGPDAWRYGYDQAARGVDEDGHPWIGAKDPKITIHEYLDYDCPHCPQGHMRLRAALNDRLDQVRIVRHDYARMKCVPNDSKNRRSRCAMARAGLCAVKAGKFWEFNDHLIESPRPLSGKERADYPLIVAKKLGLDPDEFDACMYSDDTIRRAQDIALDAQKKRIVETPSYIVDGKRLTLVEVFDLVDERL